jgi:hypothetical protein
MAYLIVLSIVLLSWNLYLIVANNSLKHSLDVSHNRCDRLQQRCTELTEYFDIPTYQRTKNSSDDLPF